MDVFNAIVSGIILLFAQVTEYLKAHPTLFWAGLAILFFYLLAKFIDGRFNRIDGRLYRIENRLKEISDQIHHKGFRE